MLQSSVLSRADLTLLMERRIRKKTEEAAEENREIARRSVSEKDSGGNWI